MKGPCEMRWNSIRCWQSRLLWVFLFGIVTFGFLFLFTNECQPSSRSINGIEGKKRLTKSPSSPGTHANEGDDGDSLNYNDVFNDDGEDVEDGDRREGEGQTSSADFGQIPCLINGKRTVQCLRDVHSQEVYLPFGGFLEKYLEVTGLGGKDSKTGEEVFEWWHSDAKFHDPPSKPYDPTGVFGPYFASYNVEHRDRVKCISAIESVPMSVQWVSEPYFYPVQIAQYALEHYSKNITEPPPTIAELNEKWHVAPDYKKGTVIERGTEEKQNFMHLRTDESLDNPGVFIELDQRPLLVIQFYIMFLDTQTAQNSSFTITVERLDTRSFYHIHYVQMSECVVYDGKNSIYYGLGSSMSGSVWRRMTRNILTDFTRGLAAVSKKKTKVKILPEQLRLVSLGFRGDVRIRDLSQRQSAHISQFWDAADWLLNHQNEDGGWKIPVGKQVAADKRLSLNPGWHSAMAQGHGMSVLSRAFHLSKNHKYLDGALRATKIFERTPSEGGVKNLFMDQYPWYEEYPTTPGSFVLNGFIYSLLGLYDLKTISGEQKGLAARLYEDGIGSLKTLLPLYDAGQGSFYDLRHISIRGANPNLARWDYHAVHIDQLLWLYSVEKDDQFKLVADRWIKYAKGDGPRHKRAKHS